MMEAYGFTYDVQPPGPPFDKQTIPMVGWREDPIQKQLTNEYQDALGDPEALAAVLEKEAALRRPVPFSEYVDKALAVYIKPYDYSYGALVRAISQQEGSGHEDSAIDEPLAQMHQVAIGGHPSHIAALIGFADLVLRVGMAFLDYATASHDYTPRYFTRAT